MRRAACAAAAATVATATASVALSVSPTSGRAWRWQQRSLLATAHADADANAGGAEAGAGLDAKADGPRSAVGGTAKKAAAAATAATAATAASPDCEEPACDDTKALFFSTMSRKKQQQPQRPETTCPLNRAELGRATWALLHTTAAYYPVEPSEEHQAAARGLVGGVAALYACEHCREHFVAHIEEHPPDVSSRDAFALWLCTTHNAVNEILDKPEFKCSPEALQTRWRTGCRKKRDGPARID